MELPPPIGRLNLPIIETSEKVDMMDFFRNQVESFIDQFCFYVPGSVIKFSDFYEKFNEEYQDISKIEVGKQLLRMGHKYPKGAVDGTNQMFIGNIAWEEKEGGKKLSKVKGRLK
jgi:hypothetical protein